MNKLVWTKKYSVGVPLFDAQHKIFFKIINDLFAIKDFSEKGKKTLFAAVGRMGDYAVYHLGSEEEQFHKYDYPDKKQHIKTHNEFRKSIQKYFNQLYKTKTVSPKLYYEIIGFAASWLTEHTLVVDKYYKSFFKDKDIPKE